MKASRLRAVIRVLSLVVLGGLLLGGAFWAGRQSLAEIGRAAEAAPAPSASPLWRVKSEQVGRSLRLTGTLSRGTQPGPAVAAQGVVTSIALDPSKPVTAGTTLFTVNLRPVVAGQGSIPAFRDLAKGAEGADVTQLRRFLCDLRRLKDCTSRTFDESLERVVTQWNQDRGLGKQPGVEAGDILWFPALPHQIAVEEKFTVGSRVEPGQQAFLTVSDTVALTVELTREQAALVPIGSAIRLGDLTASVGAVEPGTTEERMALRIVDPATGQPACEGQSECAELLGAPRTRTVEVLADVVPRVAGLAVPVKALHADAAGETYVLDGQGQRHPVTVTTQAGGLAICEGLSLGMEVRLDEPAG